MPKSAAEAASAELDRVDRVVRQAVQNGSVEYVGDDLNALMKRLREEIKGPGMRAVYDADKFVWRFASAFRHYRKGEISAPDFIQAQRTDLAKFDARTQKPGPSSSGPLTKAPSATPAKAAKASTPVKNLAYVALPSGRPIVDTQNALGPAVIRRPKEGASQAAQKGTEAAVPPLADGRLAPSSKARQPPDSVVYARPRSSANSAAVPTAGDVETKKGRKEVKAKGEGKKGGNETDATGGGEPSSKRRESKKKRADRDGYETEAMTDGEGMGKRRKVSKKPNADRDGYETEAVTDGEPLSKRKKTSKKKNADRDGYETEAASDGETLRKRRKQAKAKNAEDRGYETNAVTDGEGKRPKKRHNMTDRDGYETDGAPSKKRKRADADGPDRSATRPERGDGDSDDRPMKKSKAVQDKRPPRDQIPKAEKEVKFLKPRTEPKPNGQVNEPACNRCAKNRHPCQVQVSKLAKSCVRCGKNRVRCVFSTKPTKHAPGAEADDEGSDGSDKDGDDDDRPAPLPPMAKTPARRKPARHDNSSTEAYAPRRFSAIENGDDDDDGTDDPLPRRSGVMSTSRPRRAQVITKVPSPPPTTDDPDADVMDEDNETAGDTAGETRPGRESTAEMSVSSHDDAATAARKSARRAKRALQAAREAKEAAEERESMLDAMDKDTCRNTENIRTIIQTLEGTRSKLSATRRTLRAVEDDNTALKNRMARMEERMRRLDGEVETMMEYWGMPRALLQRMVLYNDTRPVLVLDPQQPKDQDEDADGEGVEEEQGAVEEGAKADADDREMAVDGVEAGTATVDPADDTHAATPMDVDPHANGAMSQHLPRDYMASEVSTPSRIPMPSVASSSAAFSQRRSVPLPPEVVPASSLRHGQIRSGNATSPQLPVFTAAPPETLGLDPTLVTPQVNMIPPTPTSSQEVATYGQTTLVEGNTGSSALPMPMLSSNPVMPPPPSPPTSVIPTPPPPSTPATGEKSPPLPHGKNANTTTFRPISQWAPPMPMVANWGQGNTATSAAPLSMPIPRPGPISAPPLTGAASPMPMPVPAEENPPPSPAPAATHNVPVTPSGCLAPPLGLQGTELVRRRSPRLVTTHADAAPPPQRSQSRSPLPSTKPAAALPTDSENL